MEVSKDEEEGAASISTQSIKQEATSDDESNSPPPVTFSQFASLAKPEGCMIAVALTLMVCAEGIGLVTPLIIARAYDTLVDPDIATQSERLSEINRFMALVLIVHAVGMVTGYLRAAILGAAGERVVARLRNNLYRSILQQEIAFFDQHKSGELTSRLGSDTTLLQQAVSQSLPEAILGLVKVVTAVALQFWISAKLAGLTVGSVIVVFVIAAPFGGWIARLAKEYQNVLGEAQSRSTEALGAMRTVQAFAAQFKEAVRYQVKIGNPDAFKFWWPIGVTPETKSTYSVGFSKALATAGFFVFIFGFGFGIMYGVLWYGFSLVTDDEITLGDLTAFQSYIFQIGFALGGTTGHISKVFEAIGASGRIFYLLERVPAIPCGFDDDKSSKGGETEKGASKPDLQGDIDFSKVSFSYPTRPNALVLDAFSLHVPCHSTTALVGASGAGKSTVVALLQRFYDVNGGSISIRGVDIRDMNVHHLRSHIGYVQQEPVLFGVSARDNIVYGINRDVSQEELEEVCRAANAHEFITNFPEGYDTLVGERGVKLSGGQKQRLAIARALLPNPAILVLDEATSALDAESEYLVQEAINKATVGRTVFVVAHRLSTIQRADQIVVLDHHKIVDVGTHGSLLGRCEKYQDLIKRQSMVSSDEEWQAVLRTSRLRDSMSRASAADTETYDA